MFNFRSLAEVVGVGLEGENAGRRLSQIEIDQGRKEPRDSPSQQGLGSSDVETSKADKTGNEVVGEPREGPSASQAGNAALGDTNDDLIAIPGSLPPPKVTVTPDTPAPVGPDDEDFKQLGCATAVEHVHQMAQ